MRKRMILALLPATGLLAAVLPLSAASAATVHVLTYGAAGATGKTVTIGSVIRAPLKFGTEATFFSPGTTTGVTCDKATVKNTVTANPLKPGVARESLTAQSFSECTTNIPGTTSVQAVKALNLPYTVTISDAAGFPVTVFNPTTRITLNSVIGTISCTYKAPSLKGNASNTGSVQKFVNQLFTLSSGSSACPTQGSFSATFGPYRDISVANSPRVFVN